MLYVVALIFPPLALLLAGKIFQAVFNFLLMITILGWFFAIIWAILVVANHYADARTDRIIQAMQAPQGGTAQTRFAPPKFSPFGQTAKPQPRFTQEEIEERRAERAEARARTWEAIRAIPGRLLGFLAESYRNLPEWAQPVVWGLGAASPVLVAFVVYLVWSRTGAEPRQGAATTVRASQSRVDVKAAAQIAAPPPVAKVALPARGVHRIDVQVSVMPGRRARVEGTTNLPVGTALVSLIERPAESGALAQGEAKVAEGGSFAFEPMELAEAFGNGPFVATVTTPEGGTVALAYGSFRLDEVGSAPLDAQVRPKQPEPVQSTPTSTPNRNSVVLRRQDFGDQWPLKVDEAVLSCEPATGISGRTVHILLVRANGTTYALNGTARGKAAKNGWEVFEKLLAGHDGSSVLTPEQYKFRAELIDRGLKLCP